MPATKFLFWNIGRKPLAQLVSELAEIHGVDVIMLAECETDPGAMLQGTESRARDRLSFPGKPQPKNSHFHSLLARIPSASV